MPSRNIIKTDVPDSYYHIYARGGSKRPIFLDAGDYAYFTNLFARYLSNKPAISKEGTTYPHYKDVVCLVAYCLMNNHFHLLVYQKEVGGMTRLMRSIMTSYSRYFNLKYRQSGALFESRYKASRIDVQSYLEHISRYIHLNPRNWRTHRYSSLGYYKRRKKPEWLRADLIMSTFETSRDYMNFLADYEDYKVMLSEIKHELADN